MKSHLVHTGRVPTRVPDFFKLIKINIVNKAQRLTIGPPSSNQNQQIR